MFEGKEVTYITRNGTVIDGVVVACVKDLGVTIVNKDDPDQILLCLIGRNAPNFTPAWGKITGTEITFTRIRKQIIKGVIDKRDSPRTAGTMSVIPRSHCPFSQ